MTNVYSTECQNNALISHTATQRIWEERTTKYIFFTIWTSYNPLLLPVHITIPKYTGQHSQYMLAVIWCSYIKLTSVGARSYSHTNQDHLMHTIPKHLIRENQMHGSPTDIHSKKNGYFGYKYVETELNGNKNMKNSKHRTVCRLYLLWHIYWLSGNSNYF